MTYMADVLRQDRLDERLPFFVYGTLRRGQGNHRRLEARTEAEYAAVLPDHALYEAGLPYATDARRATVVGELVFARPERYDQVLAELDRLEGYCSGRAHCHYERVRRPVHYADAHGSERTMVAWVYRAGPLVRAQLAGADPVPGGDWLGRGRRRGLLGVG